jgi:[protein-PII] uridylyltransferase
LAERKQARIAQAKEALRAALADWSAADFDAFVALGYPDYWLGLDTATQARHAHLVRAAERGKKPLTVDTRVERAKGATELTIYTGDHPGLFSVIAGAIAVSGGNIVDAKIFTMTNGMALDTFWIQDALAWGSESGGGPFEGRERLAALESTIAKALGGRKKLIQELAARPSSLPSRTHVFKVAPRVLVDNAVSSTHTVIEVNGRDRPGLLFHLTRTLTALGLQIANAKIATYGEKAVDVFYVKDVFGLKVENEMKISQIKAALLAVLAEPEATVPPAKAKTQAVSRSQKRSRAKAAAPGRAAPHRAVKAR